MSPEQLHLLMNMPLADEGELIDRVSVLEHEIIELQGMLFALIAAMAEGMPSKR
ncbi:hypothetical protein [Sphingomonas sp.]|uniref:hypothetical protein n=1 Tax=Sphingomonas sp. TaxID=28214 RepID=UPI0025E77F30|nr:hypothetical protein [Sphingomonas sp.]